MTSKTASAGKRPVSRSGQNFGPGFEQVVVVVGFLCCLGLGALLARTPFLALAVFGSLGSLAIYLLAPQWMAYAALLFSFTALPDFVPPGKVVTSSVSIFFHETFVILAVIFLIPLNRTRGTRLSILLVPLTYCAFVMVSALLGLLNGNDGQWVFVESRFLLMLAAGFMLAAVVIGAGLVTQALRLMALSLWVSAILTVFAALTGFRLRGRNESLTDATGTAVSGAIRIISWANTPALITVVALIVIAMSGRLKFEALLIFGLPAFIISLLSFSRNSVIAIGVAVVGGIVINLDRSTIRQSLKVLLYVAGGFIFVAGAGLLVRWTGVSLWIVDQASAYSTRVFGSVSLGARDSSLQFRLEEIRLLSKAIRESPLIGHGFGYPYRSITTYERSDWFRSAYRPFFSHNFYYWYLSKTGLVGMVGFAWFALLSIIDGLRSASWEAKVSSVVAVALLVVAYVWPIPELQPDNICLGMALGAAMAFGKGLNREVRDDAPSTSQGVFAS